MVFLIKEAKDLWMKIHGNGSIEMLNVPNMKKW
jgi:hypothetical protein